MGVQVEGSTQITKKHNWTLLLVVSSHEESLGFVSRGFEIPATETSASFLNFVVFGSKTIYFTGPLFSSHFFKNFRKVLCKF